MSDLKEVKKGERDGLQLLFISIFTILVTRSISLMGSSVLTSVKSATLLLSAGLRHICALVNSVISRTIILQNKRGIYNGTARYVYINRTRRHSVLNIRYIFTI